MFVFFFCVSQSNKWSFVEASARSPANKNNIKNQYFFGVSICFCSNLLCSGLVLSASNRRIRHAQKRELSLSLSLAHGKCKLNSFCMFEELSHITRSSLRLSLFNCPSISGVVVVLRLLRWLSQSQAPSRDVEFDVAALEEPQTGAETEM